MSSHGRTKVYIIEQLCVWFQEEKMVEEASNKISFPEAEIRAGL